MFKKLSEKPVAEVQNEQVKKWKEEDLLKLCVDAMKDLRQPTANRAFTT